jgi:hypothetical protein
MPLAHGSRGIPITAPQQEKQTATRERELTGWPLYAYKCDDAQWD